MRTPTTSIRFLWVAACAILISLPAARAQVSTVAPTLPKGFQTTPPVKARLWLSEGKEKVLDTALVGLGDGKFAYASPEAPAVVKGVLDGTLIQRALFEPALDYGELAQAERKRDWVMVYRLLNAAFAPTLPYLSLADNNAADYVMQLGTVMMRIAARTERNVRTDEDRARLVKQYEAAYGIFQQLAKAEWSPLGNLAVIKGSQCLLKMGKPKTAQFYLDEMQEPMPGDAAYGFYWLTRGLLASSRGETQGAMDAAVLSLAFENKDIETFPDALMLSAQCYEELQEWHRARDVYFEVASLFPDTDWADEAATRLKAILEGGKTDAKEESLIENVFFGVNEDINELSRKLLEDRAKEVADGDAEEPARRAPPKE